MVRQAILGSSPSCISLVLLIFVLAPLARGTKTVPMWGGARLFPGLPGTRTVGLAAADPKEGLSFAPRGEQDDERAHVGGVPRR